MNFRDSKRGLLNFQFGDGSHSHFPRGHEVEEVEEPTKTNTKRTLD
jgi:hypothetical protein